MNNFHQFIAVYLGSSKSFIMADKIELFQTVQSLYKMLGVHPPHPDRSPSFNCKFSLVLLTEALIFFESIAFMIFEANSVMDYGNAFSASLMFISALFYCIVNKIRMPNILELIENCEKFIDNSKTICILRTFLYTFSFHIILNITNRTTRYGSTRTVHEIEPQNQTANKGFL